MYNDSFICKWKIPLWFIKYFCMSHYHSMSPLCKKTAFLWKKVAKAIAVVNDPTCSIFFFLFIKVFCWNETNALQNSHTPSLTFLPLWHACKLILDKLVKIRVVTLNLHMIYCESQWIFSDFYASTFFTDEIFFIAADMLFCWIKFWSPKYSISLYCLFLCL